MNQLRFFVSASLLCTLGCLSGPGARPIADATPRPLALRDPAALPALRCGRKSSKPVEVRVDALGQNHISLTLTYPSLGQQFKYVIDEVRVLESGQKAMAGHKLVNNDGPEAWVDPSGSMVFFSGAPAGHGDLNATYRFVDRTPETHINLDTDEESSSERRSMSVYLRCENLDAFIDALAAG
jgi:hypothetical protein